MTNSSETPIGGGGSQPNFKSNTIWTGDNLVVTRGINSNCVDLIYLDPPFNSNRNFEAPVSSIAAGAAFKDMWNLSDVDVFEHGELAERSPAAYKVIDAARATHGKGMMSYLIFMAVRLIELQRILKPSGSIYLHCDDTAGAYPKCYWMQSSAHQTVETRFTGNERRAMPKVANLNQKLSVVSLTIFCTTQTPTIIPLIVQFKHYRQSY